ncbi:MAG: DUF2391 family protein [Bacillota bacterium]
MAGNNDRGFQIKRIGGYLHKVKVLKDASGNILEHVVTPLMVESRPRDVLQVIIGASILAVPVGMTEETWNLGADLPMLNVLALALLGLIFIGFFVYLNFYRHMLMEYKMEFVKRILMIYLTSLLVVGVFLVIINKFPFYADRAVAIKRLLIITFPCSMSGTITDGLK